MNLADLDWAEAFWKGISPYVHLRQADRLLILPPNRVFKLNQTGWSVLDFLSRGGRLSGIPGMDEARIAETQAFFDSLRRVYDGEEASLDRLPYDFDFTRLPVLGEIALTYRCNHACLFCYAGCGGEEGRLKAKESAGDMSRAQVERVIDIFKEEAQIPFFSFTGGEPTLREDLEGLIRYATGKGLRVNLISNGTLIGRERAKALADAGLSSAQISLEAAEAVVHDYLTGVDGSFSRALAGIAALQEAGISVQTNTTLTRENALSAPSMPAFLKSLGVMRFSMNLFIPAGRGKTQGQLFLPYSEIGDIVDRVRKAAFMEALTFFWYSPTPFCHYNPIARGLGNKSCAAMDGLISVNPSGHVLPCSSWDEPMGSLLEDGFERVWFSARADHIKHKRYAPPECSGCPSFTACQSACPLYWQYAGTGELQGRNPRPAADKNSHACLSNAASGPSGRAREISTWN